MDDYIKREAIQKRLNRIVEVNNLRTDRAWFTPYGVNALIEEIPAADVAEVRHGRWLPDYDYTEYDFDGSTPLLEPRKFQDGWQCSLCGQYESSETKYCPNCGAKMDYREGDEDDGKENP